MPEHSKVKFCFWGLSGTLLLNIFNPQLVEPVDLKPVDMEDYMLPSYPRTTLALLAD